MQYLLDFDRTVFDMEQLYDAIATTNPTADLGTIASLDGIDLTQFLFSDARQFFATHPPESIEIVSSGFGLTGQWEVEYQTHKIERSGVAEFVGAIHVVPDSKIATIKRLARTHELVTYVDDHPEHIADAVQHISGLQVVLLDRTGVHTQITGAKTIDSLTALDATIQPS